MNTLIKAEHLYLGYEGESVLEDISFEIAEGDYLCILGENGAGKSTLIKAILSLIEPQKGKIEFSNSIDRKEIGYLAQRTDAQKNFPSSVEEVVMSGRVNSLAKRFFYNAEDKKIVDENLKRLGIYELKKRSFSSLSGGQAQRALLARALSACKKLLLLDEPATGLDSHSISEFYKIIDRLNESGLTVIMVTHDVHPALNSASHVMYLGRNYFFGKKDAFFSSSIGKTFLKEAGHND